MSSASALEVRVCIGAPGMAGAFQRWYTPARDLVHHPCTSVRDILNCNTIRTSSVKESTVVFTDTPTGASLSLHQTAVRKASPPRAGQCGGRAAVHQGSITNVSGLPPGLLSSLPLPVSGGGLGYSYTGSRREAGAGRLIGGPAAYRSARPVERMRPRGPSRAGMPLTSTSLHRYTPAL